MRSAKSLERDFLIADLVVMTAKQAAKKWGLALGAVFVAATAHAQQLAGRTFVYTPTDAVDKDYSLEKSTVLKLTSRAVVQPYLYISGNLGANWEVNGWGAASDSRTEQIKIYHNETLTFALSGFADLIKAAGGKTGQQKIPIKMRFVFANGQSSATIFDSGLVTAAAANQLFSPSQPQFDPNVSGGLTRLSLTRTIDIAPNVGPGTYENAGTITVVRN
jgi:hypothetical protein